MDPSQNPTQPPQTPVPPSALPPQQPPLPPAQPPDQQPQVVQVTRPLNPSAPDMPAEIQRRHEESKKNFPHLNLSPGEFVIDSVRRHPIGVVKIWFSVAIIIVVLTLFAFLFSSLSGVEGALISGTAANSLLFVGIVVLAVLASLGGIIATYVYNNNRFYLTNESVIQEIMNGLFSRHVQTVSLANIEDASFRQEGVVPHLFGYGDIRLSTEGDETTYRFSYVANPSKHIAKLNNAVEAFKNGRPVLVDED